MTVSATVPFSAGNTQYWYNQYDQQLIAARQTAREIHKCPIQAPNAQEYTVQLGVAPSRAVTVTPGALTYSATMWNTRGLTFTATNWHTAQVVTEIEDTTSVLGSVAAQTYRAGQAVSVWLLGPAGAPDLMLPAELRFDVADSGDAGGSGNCGDVPADGDGRERERGNPGIHGNVWRRTCYRGLRVRQRRCGTCCTGRWIHRRCCRTAEPGQPGPDVRGEADVQDAGEGCGKRRV